MGLRDHKKDDEESGGSGTYLQFESDKSEAQRKAYRLCSRGGQLREGLDDIDETFAELAPLLADILFEDEPSGLLEWLELGEEDWEAYAEEHLND